MAGVELRENLTFDELRVGAQASLSRVVSEQDIASFAAVSGDTNPAHLDPDFAAQERFGGVVAHGMLSGALISTLLGTRLPGPGTIYVAQDLEFVHPVRIGDTVTVTVTVHDKRPEGRRVVLDCLCVNQDGVAVARGTATVIAPARKLRMPIQPPPPLIVQTHDSFRRLMHAAQSIPAVRCAVAHPCSPDALSGALEAADEDLIVPVLVGPIAKMRAVAAEAGLDLGKVELLDVPHSHAAADKAVELIRTGQAELLMKGSLHTDELLGAVVAKETGLQAWRGDNLPLVKGDGRNDGKGRG